jgi:hypothetical protein
LVRVSVPRPSVPIVAEVAKRFVELAVVENRDVVVALVAVTAWSVVVPDTVTEVNDPAPALRSI